MKKIAAYALTLTWAIHAFAASAETCIGRFWCRSVRLEGTGFLYFTTAINGVNGELAPGSGTYGTKFTLTPPVSPTSYSFSGPMWLDLPAFADVNGNGFDDFFESALPVSATTSGSYFAGGGGGATISGTTTATWQRDAGSPEGNCVLHLQDSTYGDLHTYSFTFTIIEYTGTVVYTPGTNTVTGSVNLVQTGYPMNAIAGPFQFVKNPTNRFDLLTLQSGTWTNNTTQMLLYTTMPYTSSLFNRGTPWTTNYYGSVQLAIPGPPPPNGPPLGYFNWALSIDDTNDVDHNGLSDFSDDLSVAMPLQPPALTMTCTAGNVLLSVSGNIGSRVDLQRALSLPATNWFTVVSLSLTNDPQVLTFTNPAAPAAFWRALAH